MKILDYDDVKRLKEKAEKSEEAYIPVSCFMILKFIQKIELLEKEADFLATEVLDWEMAQATPGQKVRTLAKIREEACKAVEKR